MPLIRCRAATRVSAKPCDGFVARIPYPVRFVDVVDRHEDADPTSLVIPCLSCQTLHEFAPAWKDAA